VTVTKRRSCRPRMVNIRSSRLARHFRGAKIDLDDAAVSGAVVSTVAGSTINSLAETTNSLSSAESENAGTLAVAAGSTLNFNGSAQNTGQVQQRRENRREGGGPPDLWRRRRPSQ
jgi:hypothetical protein